MRLLALLTSFVVGALATAQAEPSTLEVNLDGASRAYAASELLARPDAATITVSADADYRRPMTYRAVPLLPLLHGLARDRYDTLEARATDGFVAQIPMAVIDRAASGGAVPWIAVEPPGENWPNLPGKDVSAGPFYLVWQNLGRSGIVSEQWPYQLASLTAAESPAHRWPQLALDPARQPTAQAQRGQAVFATLCLPCHKLNGGGAADVGPDLGQPMNATSYLTEAGMRALIRNPLSVRTWPQRQMPAFDPADLPDSDIDAVIAFLRGS